MQVDRIRGDTAPDVFAITTASTGEPTNLTGCSFKLTVNSVKNPVDSTTQAYQLVGEIPDPTTGQVLFSPTEAQADKLGFFYYDVQMTDSYAKIRTLVKGVYCFSQDITK